MKVVEDQNLVGIGMTSQRTRSRLVTSLRGKGISHETVLETISSTPRHLFVEEALQQRAYEETALPIGFNQTISQPYIVAKMIELLLAESRAGKILEIGTGSGYQTSILAEIYQQVYTLERIKELQIRAKQKLRRLKRRNVYFRHQDGADGWPEKAPFDAIIVSAAAPQIPEALLDQLAERGTLVIPVDEEGHQQLVKVQRLDGKIRTQLVESVHFVPMLPGRIS